MKYYFMYVTIVMIKSNKFNGIIDKNSKEHKKGKQKKIINWLFVLNKVVKFICLFVKISLTTSVYSSSF